MRDKIIVLDFGSQYAHLIAKRFRRLGYYSEILLPSAAASQFEKAKGIVLSGGPSSVYEKDVPEFNQEILNLGIPVLGLCYGHQLLAQTLGGSVSRATVGEFGISFLENSGCEISPLFKGVKMPAQVWMSHQDEVSVLPPGFKVMGFTKDCKIAGMQNLQKGIFGLQCHVEVKDTPEGDLILENFARYCGMEVNWSQDEVLELIISDIRKTAGNKNVLLFLSGGVDSTVAFALLNKALGQERVLGLHIDNGFMRKDESHIIGKRYRDFGFENFITEDASGSFLQAVYKETDPQKKRMAVGENFITVRNKVLESQNLDENNFLLAQGTLYPDIIESGGTKNSKTIKTHHNRVDGIQKLIEKGLIIEPLKDLYKDEVRMIGKKLGLSDELVYRHPFPGPGLSINVLCSTGVLDNPGEYEEAVKKLPECREKIKEKCRDISLDFELRCLPVRSVGVQGDFRTYRFPLVLDFSGKAAGKEKGASNTLDLLTEENWQKLEKISSEITNNFKSFNRTVLCFWEKDGCRLQEGYCDKGRLDQIRAVDAVVLEVLKETGWYRKIFQHLTINLPFASCKENCSIVLRPVISEDVMTARFANLDRGVLKMIIDRLVNLDYIDGLYYDITNKPPATFGWE